MFDSRCVFLGIEYDDELKNIIDKILDEWSCGVKGETIRVTTCLQLLKDNLLLNLSEILDTILKTFSNIYEKIRSR